MKILEAALLNGWKLTTVQDSYGNTVFRLEDAFGNFTQDASLEFLETYWLQYNVRKGR